MLVIVKCSCLRPHCEQQAHAGGRGCGALGVLPCGRGCGALGVLPGGRGCGALGVLSGTARTRGRTTVTLAAHAHSLDRRPTDRPARHDFGNLPTLPPAATQTTMRRNTLNHFFGRMSLLFVEIEFPGEMVV